MPDAVLIQFDDGDATVYTTAYPILSAAGLTATAYILPDRIGTAGHMTEAQILELHAAGWDIANHTSSQVNLTTLTEAEQETAISSCAAYLDGLGLTRASKHVAYPYGASNADTLTAMAATGMLTGRTVTSTEMTTPIGAPYALTGCVGLSPTNTLWSAMDRIPSASAGGIVIYFGHIVDADGGKNSWTTADLQSLVDYIVASGCRVVTISQLWDYVQNGYVWS